MSDRLLIVTNNPARVFQRNIVAGASEVCSGAGVEVAVVEVPTPGEASALLDGLAVDQPLMLVANVLPDELIALAHERTAPLTLVSHSVSGLEVPAIVHDNEHGMALLAHEVLDRGGRSRPLFVGGSTRQRDAQEREVAFRRELMRRGLELDDARFLPGEFEPAQAARAVREFLEHRGPAFDSLVAADYLMAIAGLEVLQSEGLRVPAEVLVAGFGDGPEAEGAGVTTVAADVMELGRRAARQLLAQVGGMQIRGLTLLSTKLIRRATTA